MKYCNTAFILLLFFLLGTFNNARAEELIKIDPPIIITRGGTYVGHWIEQNGKRPITVETTEPVIISGSVSGPGELIRAINGSQITIRHLKAYGDKGRFFSGESVKSIEISNCTIEKSSGIYILNTDSTSSILITRNNVKNIQKPTGNGQFVQLDKVNSSAIDISWNQVINKFGESEVEDIINLFRTSNADIHDNYLQGAFPLTISSNFSGSGIMVGDYGGNNNKIHDNQIVSTTNAGIGIVGGSGNIAYKNTIIGDGKNDYGDSLKSANIGLFVWNINNSNEFALNSAYDNQVGWINASGARNDWWLPDCTKSCRNYNVSGSIDKSTKTFEFGKWMDKLKRNEIIIGAKTPTPPIISSK